MVAMSTKSKIFAYGMIAAGSLVIFMSLAGWSCADYGRFATLLGLGILSSQVKFRIPGFSSTFTASLFIVFICVVELSLGETTVISLAAAGTQTLWRAKQRPDLLKFAFNLSCLAVSAVGCQVSYLWLNTHFSALGAPAILALTACVYFFLNTAPVSFMITIIEGGDFVTVWRNAYFTMYPFYLAGSAVAGIMHYPTKLFGWQATFLLVPLLYLLQRFYETFIGRMEDTKRHVDNLAALQMRSIRTMAVAVEAKDETTATHLHRVQTYAMGIGKELGLSASDMKALEAAAILHDVGKLAVPEHIISKPGKLTAEEFELMKIHTIVGSEIVEGMEFPYPVAPIVRAHHEKWNGTGYPDGLGGTDIPIGARILSAVDCLDALATDRQYRRALPLQQAMEMVTADSGKAFDPAVVEVLLRQYRDLEAAAHASLGSIRNQRLSIRAIVDRGEAPDAGLEKSAGLGLPTGSGDDGQKSLSQLHTISTFLSSINSLMDGLQETPSAIRLEHLCYSISGRLQTLVPHDAFVVFGRSGDSIIALHARGEDADLLATLEVPLGTGLVGWVARNQKPIVNGNPAVEPEADRWTRQTVLRSALAVPLSNSDTVGGVIALYSCTADHFSRQQVKVLKLLAPRLLQMISENQQEKGMQVFNNEQCDTKCAEFLGVLDAAIHEVTTDGEPLLLIRIDLDSRKTIAALKGELAAEQFTEQCAELLRQGFRLNDRLGRLGPNEFALLVRGIDMTSMLGRLEIAWGRIDEASTLLLGRQESSITFGVAEFSPGGGSLEELLAEAERAVCEARSRRASTGLRRLSKALASAGEPYSPQSGGPIQRKPVATAL